MNLSCCEALRERTNTNPRALIPVPIINTVIGIDLTGPNKISPNNKAINDIRHDDNIRNIKDNLDKDNFSI